MAITRVKASNRVLIAGKTGSGKTYLARQLLLNVQRLILIDSKGTLNNWQDNTLNKRNWRNFVKGDIGRFRLQPPIVDNPFNWYENLFERLYYLKNFTLYIDEIYGVIPPGQRIGKWLNALITRGREKNIGVWGSTQRPTWIPLSFISEVDYLFVFQLQLASDRQRLASVGGEKLLRKIGDKHGFYLINMSEDHPQYFSNVVDRVTN